MNACGKSYNPRDERYLIGRCRSGVECDKLITYAAPSNKSPNYYCAMWSGNEKV